MDIVQQNVLAAVVFFALVGLAWWAMSTVVRRQTRAIDLMRESFGKVDQVAVQPGVVTPDIEAGDVVLRSMSARISALEGRLPALAGALDSFTTLATRLSAIETAMPGIQEAYEKYADAVNRADKRDTERARKEGNTRGREQAQTAGDAAAALGLVNPPTQAELEPAAARLPGLVGNGGRKNRSAE